MARPSNSREAGKARQGVTRHVDLRRPISRRSKPSWLRWSFRVAPVMKLARPAHQRGTENRTRQTPTFGNAPAEPRQLKVHVVKILLQVRPRKNRQHRGLNSRWRLKASSCLKEGPQPRHILQVARCATAANDREGTVPARDKGIGCSGGEGTASNEPRSLRRTPYLILSRRWRAQQ